MNNKVLPPEVMQVFAELHGLAKSAPEELEHMAALAVKVARIGAKVQRMPSKGDEPVSVFGVPK